MINILPSQQLRNFSLTLYAFDLRRELDGIGQLKPDELPLWEQLEKLEHDFAIEPLKDLNQRLTDARQNSQRSSLRFLNLLPDGEESIDFSLIREVDTEKIEINGSLSPFQLDDAYAVDITLFSCNPINLAQMGKLNLGEILLSPRIQAPLGQTLFLYAEVDALYKDDRQLSESLVMQVLGRQALPEYRSEGKLLGHSIFEYSTATIGAVDKSHTLVWLNHNQFSAEMGLVTEKILYALLSRHKILYAYSQANTCNLQAKEIYSALEQNVVQPFRKIAQAPDHLQQFQDLLRTQLPQDAFKYAQHIRNLSDYATTVDTNLKNYRRSVESLGHLLETDLTFFQDFSELAEAKYKTQIQVYLNYLTPGQSLFQQLIDSIRGLADLEQAENDRRLEATIQVLGVGLATGAIVSAGYGYVSKPWRRPFSTNTIHPFIGYLLLSFVGAVISGLITYGFTKWKARAEVPPKD